MVSKLREEHLRDGDYLLTAAEAAAILNTSRSTIYSLMQRGELPGIHIGRSLRFHMQDLRAYMGRLRTDAARRSLARTGKRR